MQHTTADNNILVDFADSDLNIRSIHVLYNKIQDSLAEREEVALSLSENSAVDLSFIQLLESARLHARDLGKKISLTRPAGANIRRVLERGGFLTHPAPETLRFWFHQERTQ